MEEPFLVVGAERAGRFGDELRAGREVAFDVVTLQGACGVHVPIRRFCASVGFMRSGKGIAE